MLEDNVNFGIEVEYWYRISASSEKIHATTTFFNENIEDYFELRDKVINVIYTDLLLKYGEGAVDTYYNEIFRIGWGYSVDGLEIVDFDFLFS